MIKKVSFWVISKNGILLVFFLIIINIKLIIKWPEKKPNNLKKSSISRTSKTDPFHKPTGNAETFFAAFCFWPILSPWGTALSKGMRREIPTESGGPLTRTETSAGRRTARPKTTPTAIFTLP
jgi:hypothetical protein